MKRRDVITHVSLRLFNELGEGNLAAIDIANELDISPGNLYYHFKGKEQIIAELFKQFSTQLNDLLAAGVDEDNFLIDCMLHLYVLLELIYDYRFFLRNVNDFVANYPDTGKKLIRLVDRLRQGLVEFLSILAKLELINIGREHNELIERLANNLLLVLIYWDSYKTALDPVDEKRDYVESAGLQILSMISPYLSSQQLQQLDQCHQSYMEGNGSQSG